MNRGPNIAIEKLCWDLYELLFLKQHSVLIAIIHWESNMNLLQSKNYVVSDTKVFSKTIPELISCFFIDKNEDVAIRFILPCHPDHLHPMPISSRWKSKLLQSQADTQGQVYPGEVIQKTQRRSLIIRTRSLSWNNFVINVSP